MPTAILREVDREAYRAVYVEKASGTGEVSAVQRLGRKVVLVVNDDFNFKITYPRDLALAEFVLKRWESDPES